MLPSIMTDSDYSKKHLQSTMASKITGSIKKKNRRAGRNVYDNENLGAASENPMTMNIIDGTYDANESYPA